jgi:hypothetical protein
MKRILIKNAKIVNEGKIFEGDVLIEDELIFEIADSISAKTDYKVIDAEGNYLYQGQLMIKFILENQDSLTKVILLQNLKRQLLAESPLLLNSQIQFLMQLLKNY